MISRVRKVSIRYGRMPQEEANRGRDTMLKLQVESILAASRAAHVVTPRGTKACGETELRDLVAESS